MVAKKKTHRNGGKKPTMQPEKDTMKQETTDTTKKPQISENTDREAIEAMSGKLDDATTCQLDDEFEAERAQAEAQTVQNELVEAVAAANAKAEEYLTLAQRVQADFDNYRRRNQNARGEAFEDGARAFVTTLLPVLDNLERAISAADSSTDKAPQRGRGNGAAAAGRRLYQTGGNPH